MKHSSLIIAILLIAAIQALSQNGPPGRKIIYKISISDSSSESFKGYLYDLTDSTLKLSLWPVRLRAPESKDIFKEVDYSHIQKVKLRRNHGAGRGAWKGALIGAVIGVIAGFVEGDDDPESWISFTASEKALMYGSSFGAVGTGIGAIIGGSVKKTYTIGGRKENFDAMKEDVLTKTYGTTVNIQQ